MSTRTPHHLRARNFVSQLRPAVLALSTILSLSAAGAPPPATVAPPGAAAKPRAGKPVTAQTLEPFFDDVVPKELALHHVPGTVVSVVKDGQVLFAKGYGYSDLDKRTPMSAATTLMRMGSISKVFVWTAVMQLVEAGKIDLDQDVNQYLDFRITPAGAKPITVRNLMTHTAGFALDVKDVAFRDRQSLPPLPTWVKTHIPEQYFKPGSTMSYSIYGPALAGYIVERVSGMPFEEYAEKHIFGPLAMRHSSFREPLPADLAPLVATGYLNGKDTAMAFEYMPVPTGGLSTTAEDMARFMIAMLPGSDAPGPRIMRPETLALMESRQVSPVPHAGGGTLGLWEQNVDGQRILGHAGTTSRFHAMMKLLVDAHIGLFVSSNSPGGDGLAIALFYKLMDRHFPRPKTDPPRASSYRSDAAMVAGVYCSTRGMKSDIIHVLSLFSQFDVVATSDGGITVGSRTKRYYSIGGLRFHSPGDLERDDYMFSTDALGRMILMPANSDVAFAMFLRQPVADDRRWATTAIILGIVAIVGTLIVWPISAWRRRSRATPVVERNATLAAVRATSLVDLLLIAAWAPLIVLGQGDSDLRFWLISSDSNPLFRLYSILGLLCVALTLVTAMFAVRDLLRRRHRRWTRTLCVAAAVGLGAFAWFIVHWDLASTRIRF